MTNSPFLPYGRQIIDDADITAVVDVLTSDWLTTGPAVAQFESAVCSFTGALHAVAVSNGTAALHCAMIALGIGPGDEVLVPTITFTSTANCVAFVGATPVFCDVETDTLLIDVEQVKRKITKRTKAIIAVDYAGQPCDWDVLRIVADQYDIALVADACHAIGGEYKGRNVGTLADMTCFSFHPVKHITTGEGGMVVTDDAELDRKLRLARNHGITTDHRQREKSGSWAYEMVELGFNYRLCDIQCALGIAQLTKLPNFLMKRREIAALYDAAFEEINGVTSLLQCEDRLNAYHLYVVKLSAPFDRKAVFDGMRAAKIGVNVHYIPVHTQPYYQEQHDTYVGLCPVAEAAYEQILSLPMFPGMTEGDVKRVVDTLVALR